MRLTQIDTFLIGLLYLSAAGIVILTVLGVASAVSALFYLTFILVILLWCSGALRSVVWTDAVMILTIGLSLAHVITNAWLEEAEISFDYFKKYMMFVCTLVCFQAVYKLRINDTLERFLLTLNSILIVFLIAYFYTHQAQVYLIRGRPSAYLTFGFTNPNLAALFLLCLFTGELYQLFRSRSVPGWIWHLCLAAAVCYFVWGTRSRNCMITIVFELVLFVLLQLLPKGFRISKWFAFLVAVLPMVFVLVYVAAVRHQWVEQMFAFLIGEGKTLEARMGIWLPALQIYAESPVIGAYSQISRGTGMSQMHNTHLDILTSYGTAILILTCYLLYNLIHGNREKIKEETMARICFCGTIIMGLGEAAMFSGGLGIYLYAAMFLLLCNKERTLPAQKQ